MKLYGSGYGFLRGQPRTRIASQRTTSDKSSAASVRPARSRRHFPTAEARSAPSDNTHRVAK